MVLIHVKRSENDEFLLECSVKDSNDDVTQLVCELNNTRQRIKRLVADGRELAKYGPMKPDNEHGYTEEQMAKHLEKTKVEDGEDEVQDGMDPTGRRNGQPPSKELQDTLNRTLDECEQVLSKDLVTKRTPITPLQLQEAIDRVRGAVMMAWPMGLPEFDPVHLCIEGTEDLTGTAYAKDEFDPETSTLWWANKQLDRAKALGDFVGRNEKTKIVAKIGRKGAGPPAREANQHDQQQKEMMAYYYKKAEEHKKLMEDTDDSYANSTWADPKSLKNAFTGTGGVSWRPR